MNFLARMERAIEEIVEGIFRKAREATHPVEIGRYLLREMEDEKRISVTRTYVPNHYKVRLHARDVEYLGPLARTVSRELAAHVMSRARRQGYSFVGRVDVEFVADEAAKPGDIRVEGSFVEDDDGGEPDDASRAGLSAEETSRTLISSRGGAGPSNRDLPTGPRLIVRLNGGVERVFPLGGDRVVVGRSSSCGIVLEDTGVSRRHAEIGREAGRFYVLDLGSTNGTYVNGRRVSRQILADGDHVNFGKLAACFKEA